MVQYSEEYPLNDSSVQYLKKREQAECPIYSPSSGTFIQSLIFFFFFLPWSYFSWAMHDIPAVFYFCSVSRFIKTHYVNSLKLK